MTDNQPSDDTLDEGIVSADIKYNAGANINAEEPSDHNDAVKLEAFNVGKAIAITMLLGVFAIWLNAIIRALRNRQDHNNQLSNINRLRAHADELHNKMLETMRASKVSIQSSLQNSNTEKSRPASPAGKRILSALDMHGVYMRIIAKWYVKFADVIDDCAERIEKAIAEIQRGMEGHDVEGTVKLKSILTPRYDDFTSDMESMRLLEHQAFGEQGWGGIEIEVRYTHEYEAALVDDRSLANQYHDVFNSGDLDRLEQASDRLLNANEKFKKTTENLDTLTRGGRLEIHAQDSHDNVVVVKRVSGQGLDFYAAIEEVTVALRRQVMEIYMYNSIINRIMRLRAMLEADRTHLYRAMIRNAKKKK